MKAKDRLEAARQEWRKTELARAAQKSPLRRPEFHTDSGIPIPDLMIPSDVGEPSDAEVDKYERDLGFPGQFPYTRGPQPTMYRGRLWTMRQFAGFGTPEDTNQRFKYLLEHGVTGLSTAFDMPALMGYDADHAMSRGEVGREGVAVSTLKDFEVLFSGIPLDRVTTSMTINASAIFALCAYIAVAEKQGVSQDKLGGTIQNDVLKEYIAQKEWVVGPRPATRVVVDMIEYTAKHMPRWHPVSISGYHIREAGATAIQELAFTLADGFGYVEECVKRGMDVDDFAPRLSFFWDVHNDFFEEIAKFRAARRIYARVMRDRFGAKKAISMTLRTHAQTAGVALTAQQPYNNVVRVALQALAAVLGGTQSLHTNSLDETYALPTEDAVTIALRTQQILAHESGVDRVVDPLAGSYFVEYLTDETEKRAMEILAKIERYGGIIRAIEEGYPQREIADSAYQWQREVDSGERKIVDVQRRGVHVRRIRRAADDRAVERRRIPQLSEVAPRDRRGRKRAFHRVPAGALFVAVEGQLIESGIGGSRTGKTQSGRQRSRERGGHLAARSSRGRADASACARICRFRNVANDTARSCPSPGMLPIPSGRRRRPRRACSTPSPHPAPDA
ncbi:MAG: methylmalonyl-CoA mutase [Deltaproteobacteria bacterium]|nr:MAG: methylmalonyl-CoA mutase [Deltaproteobacteria bacterium]